MNRAHLGYPNGSEETSPARFLSQTFLILEQTRGAGIEWIESLWRGLKRLGRQGCDSTRWSHEGSNQSVAQTYDSSRVRDGGT
jgi:hypothetical protein